MNGYIDDFGNYYEGDRQGFDLVVPQRPDYTHVWNGTTWAVPTPSLDGVKATQIVSLSEICQAQIFAGFTSDALGTTYSYPAKFTDQANLSASVLASFYPNLATDWSTPFWCEDAVGVWAFRDHTAAQIQKVGMDAKTAILQAMGKNTYLAGVVNAATTNEEVQAINWDYVAPTPPVEPEPEPEPTPEPEPETPTETP